MYLYDTMELNSLPTTLLFTILKQKLFLVNKTEGGYQMSLVQ